MQAVNKSHKERIKSHLERGWGIDSEVARKKYGCHALPQRIYDLREDGLKINKSSRKRFGKTFAWYKLAKYNEKKQKNSN